MPTEAIGPRLKAILEATRARKDAVDDHLEAQRKASVQRLGEHRNALAAEELRVAGAPEKVVALFASGAFRASEKGIRAVEGFLSGDRTFLVLSGAVGSGKSAAACYAFTRMQHGYCLEAPAFDFVNPWSEAGEKMLHRARTTPLLVLDDLGSRGEGETAQKKWDHLFDGRYGSQRKTILTTNLSQLLLQREYGPRVWDRLKETGVFLSCGNVSLRQPAVGVKP